MSEITETPAGHSMGIDIDAPTALQQQQPTQVGAQFLNTVPDDYKEKDWVKDFAKRENPHAELFKEFENQKSLIGRKAEGLKVPGADAPDTDWQELYKALGVPEKPEDYKYEPP